MFLNTPPTSISSPVQYDDLSSDRSALVQYADLDQDGEASDLEYNLFTLFDLDEDGEVSELEYNFYLESLSEMLPGNNSFGSSNLFGNYSGISLEEAQMKAMLSEFEDKQSLTDSFANSMSKTAKSTTDSITQMAKGVADIGSSISDLAPSA